MDRTPTKIELLALLLILALAAWLRLGWPGVNSFSFDEARVSDMALQMVREGNFARLGMQSSTGVPNFPAAVWLFGIPYLFSTDPLPATWFVGLVNVAAVLGIWWLARAAWGKWAALTAALLFAGSPYLVLYSRNIWSQNLLAPLAVLWAVAAVKAVQEERNGWLGLHIFLAGFVGQVHIAGFVLGPASAWIVMRFRLWRLWPGIVAGGVLAVVTAVPTIYTIWRYGEGAKAELRALLDAPALTSWDGFTQLARLGLGLDWERFWLNAEWRWGALLEPVLLAGQVILGLLLAASIIWVIVRGVQQWRSAVPPGEARPAAARRVLVGFILIWAVVTPLFFLRSKTEPTIHYQLVSVPALFLLMGSAAAISKRRWWPVLILTVAGLVVLAQSIAVAQTLSTVRQELVPGGIGTPLSYPQQAVHALQADGKPIVVETFGDIAEFEGDAAVFKVLLWGYPHRIVDARTALLIPNQAAHILFTFDSLPAWEIVQTIGLAGTRTDLPRRIGEPPYVALTVTDVSLPDFNVAPPGRLANGAELQGWLVQTLDNDRLRLITYWQITAEPTEGHFQQFNHLYIEEGTEPWQVQDNYTSSRAWQRGDHLITWAEFDQPDSPIAYFQVGMYTWPDLQRSPVLNRSAGVDPLAPIQLDISGKVLFEE